jgi:endonuclease/exonuclease/phosphatase family metal-dependent hydrolase
VFFLVVVCFVFFFFASQLHVFGLHLDVYDEAGTARLKQAQQVISKIGTLENVVIAGDLNSLRRRDYCTADWEKIVEHDKLRGVAADCKTIDFLEANGFSDCFAMDPPSCSTWSGRRVDFLLLKGAIESKQAFVVHSAASDHIPIVADLVLKK